MASHLQSTFELGDVRVRAGLNYLAQAIPTHPARGIVLPAASGAVLIRDSGNISDKASKVDVDDHNVADATIVGLALSPATSDLLALSFASTSCVQIRKLSAHKSTLQAQIDDLPGSCRQLIWHPHRRLLVIAMPRLLIIAELGAGSTLTTHRLELPDHVAGSISSCCWGNSGTVLAVACDGAVLVFTWPILGAAWDRSSCLPFPIEDRRVCAIHALVEFRPCADEEEGIASDDEEGNPQEDRLLKEVDTFAISLGLPIATGQGADMNAVMDSRPPRARSLYPSAADLQSDPEVIDLRGRMGSEPVPQRSVLDLSHELISAHSVAQAALPRLPCADASDCKGGRLMLCSGGSGGVQKLCGAVHVGTAQPDMLAGTLMRASIRGHHQAGLLAASSSAIGELHVYACRYGHNGPSVVEPLLSLALPAGYRTRGIAFNDQDQLMVLGGRRQQQSVVFSSPTAHQQLALCTYTRLRDPMANASSASTAELSSPVTCPSEADCATAKNPSTLKAAKTDLPTSEMKGLFDALRAHIDHRLDAIERSLQQLNARLIRVEAAHPHSQL